MQANVQETVYLWYRVLWYKLWLLSCINSSLLIISMEWYIDFLYMLLDKVMPLSDKLFERD